MSKEMTTEELNLKSRVEYLEGEIQIHIVNERAWIERCEKAESSLEREEQAHVMSVYDLNMKIAELGIAFEKEKERADKAENLFTGSEKINIKRTNEIVSLQERVKELEAKLASIKADPSIGKLEVMNDFGEDD